MWWCCIYPVNVRSARIVVRQRQGGLATSQIVKASISIRQGAFSHTLHPATPVIISVDTYTQYVLIAILSQIVSLSSRRCGRPCAHAVKSQYDANCRLYFSTYTIQTHSNDLYRLKHTILTTNQNISSADHIFVKLAPGISVVWTLPSSPSPARPARPR